MFPDTVFGEQDVTHWIQNKTLDSENLVKQFCLRCYQIWKDMNTVKGEELQASKSKEINSSRSVYM